MLQALVTEPALQWTAGQAMTVRVTPLTLPVGRQLTDFVTWTLTIRQDPSWPRTGPGSAGPLANTRNTADPIAENWTIAVQAIGTLVNSVPTFTFTTPSQAGVERYAVDVFGTLAAGGDVQVVPCTWLTILGRLK
jgi:hypothetical protein